MKKEPSPKHPDRERKSVYSLEEVLPYVVFTRKKGSERLFDGDPIKMASQRYQLFALKGVACVSCGVKGSFFAKEKLKDETVYHFNLYSIKDGIEILMTKDHIIPKSLGGKDNLSNYQTMCKICNEKKGNCYGL